MDTLTTMIMITRTAKGMRTDRATIMAMPIVQDRWAGWPQCFMSAGTATATRR
jgi:hypothetical protein